MIGRGYRSWVVAETDAFRLDADSWGSYKLVRKADGRSVFWAGGDGREIESEVESGATERLDEWAMGYVAWEEVRP